MAIHVFTLMTSVYNGYLSNMLETLPLLFPNIEKTLTIISDKDYERENKIPTVNGYKSVYCRKIIDLPYPIIALCKTVFMTEFIPEEAEENDLFIFLDSDTKIRERNEEDWNNIYKLFDEHDLLFTKSPWFSQNTFIQNIPGVDSHVPDAFNDDEPEYASHYDITEKTVYCQTSFFGGKIKYLRLLNNDVKALMSKDLSHEDFIHEGERKQSFIRHLPLASEENYCNKIINDHIHGRRNDYNILVDDFIINYHYDFPKFRNEIYEHFPYIFLIQKYNNSIKTPKRNKS